MNKVSRIEAARSAAAELPAEGGGSRIRQRQRQRLIDACISALHIYGPSRTTVEKVVALADLSPGIVRFYFDSKAAMLVASLEYLATEFAERVLKPVEQLKAQPVAALRLLVDLYLDADIASPRKVSVWYSFWGEASSRQEYLDICGKKDEEFAALVGELVARLIAARGAAHLDADAVALGLIGVLEVLWQGFAFHSEANIDRSAAVRRSLHYLRSVFPGEFACETPSAARSAGAAPTGGRLPARAYASAALLAAERERLLRPAWQLLGHESELRLAGDFLTGELAGERALLVRGERGRLHVFRNSCRRRPHALLAPRKGHLRSAIHCASHSLTYSFDGRLVAGATPGDLTPLEMRREGSLILARAGAAAAAPEQSAARASWEAFAALLPRTVTDQEVAADWKLLIEQWLESPQPQQQFVAPNLLLEARAEGGFILQVMPLSPGRSRVRRFDFMARAPHGERRGGRSPRDAGQRRAGAWLRQQIELAESTQAGLSAAGEEPADTGPVSATLAEFREAIAALLGELPEGELRRG
ncbi:MAG: TetR family transcriptional regulator C-terminal domain-containing protein [Gammaproteobacteria bacterium]|nr:TetR family transcriptional regulator C-terminal domain-containing protein [Gammaproteobacteria bacterium]